jgi:hypothetical protein
MAPPHRAIQVPPYAPHPVPPSSPSSFPLYNLASLSADFEQDVNMSESSSDLEPSPHAAHLPDRALSPMTISLDGLRSAIGRPNDSLRTVNGPSYFASPISHDLVSCTLCGRASDSISVSNLSSAFKSTVSSGFPLVAPPGPLVNAAFESSMSAVEELCLLKTSRMSPVATCPRISPYMSRVLSWSGSGCD